MRLAKVGSDDVRCSFCSKPRSHVGKLIAGPGVFICDECIDLCNEIVEEEPGGRPPRRYGARAVTAAVTSWSRPAATSGDRK